MRNLVFNVSFEFVERCLLLVFLFFLVLCGGGFQRNNGRIQFSNPILSFYSTTYVYHSLRFDNFLARKAIRVFVF